MPLVEVIGNVIHELCGFRAPIFSVEWLAGSNKISGGVHLVRTFNLAQDNIRMMTLEGTGRDILRRPQGQGHPTVDFRHPDLRVGGAP